MKFNNVFTFEEAVTKKGDKPLCSVIRNTFGYDIEDRSVIAGDRREHGNLIEKVEIAASLRSSQ